MIQEKQNVEQNHDIIKNNVYFIYRTNVNPHVRQT